MSKEVDFIIQLATESPGAFLNSWYFEPGGVYQGDYPNPIFGIAYELAKTCLPDVPALPENMGLSDITHSQAGFTVSVYTFNNSPVVHESGRNHSVQTWREHEGTGDTWIDALKVAIAAALKEAETSNQYKLPDHCHVYRAWQRGDNGEYSVDVRCEDGGICLQTDTTAIRALAKAIKIVRSWEAPPDASEG